MLDWVVYDVEIQKTIEETPGGWDATDKLGVACACLWEMRTERMRVYGPEDVNALRERLLTADRITGYNIAAFDHCVILGLPRGETNPVRDALLETTDDILARIWDALGGYRFKGWTLDDVAWATIGVKKIGNGADAPKWFQAGQIHRVINYCCDDVAIERDLALYVEKYGRVISSLNGLLYLQPWKRH